MRKVLRFEGPDGLGPCFGRNTSRFFSRYLSRMEKASRVIEGFTRGEHLCAIEVAGFSKWVPDKEALEEAENEGLVLCIYLLEQVLEEDPRLIPAEKENPVWGCGPPREWQVAFSKEWVISVEKIPPASFCPEIHLKPGRATTNLFTQAAGVQ